MFSRPSRPDPNYMRATAPDREVVAPGRVREAEEQIPTIDDLGRRRTLICTRTWATVGGSDGRVEIERSRRYTLPGSGHVYPLDNGEFVVFRGRMKLRADPEMGVYCALPAMTDAPPAGEGDVEAKGLPRSTRAPEGRAGMRRKAVALVACLGLVSLTLAIPQLEPQEDPLPSFDSFTPPPRYPPIAAMNEPSVPAAIPMTTGSAEQPASPRKPASAVDNRDLGAHGVPARVALAIRPWGDIYVNGKKRGTTPPMKELWLKPGRYTVEIRNGGFAPYRQVVDVRAMATARLTHDFGNPNTTVADDAVPSLAALLRQQNRYLSEQWPR